MIAILFLVMAARKALGEPDEDAPPPRWKASLETATPGRAYLMGVLLLGISAKLWVFTLGAIGAIEYAAPGRVTAVALYLLFVALAQCIPIGVVAYAALAPSSRCVSKFAVASTLPLAGSMTARL